VQRLKKGTLAPLRGGNAAISPTKRGLCSRVIKERDLSLRLYCIGPEKKVKPGREHEAAGKPTKGEICRNSRLKRGVETLVRKRKVFDGRNPDGIAENACAHEKGARGEGKKTCG